jgi:predicted ferric reductase
MLFDRDPHEVFWGAVWGGLSGLALAAAGLAIGVGITGLAGDTKSFWYLSRSSGFVAYLLLWGSVAWGLLLTTKLVKGKVHPATLLNAHQFLSNLGLGFALFHGLVLMGDHYLSFPLAAVLVPLAGTYEPLLVAFGQIALWLSLLLILSFYVRRQIGQKVWRLFHYLSFVAYFAVLAHAVILGTDSGLLGIKLLYAATAGVVIFLTLYRILSAGESPRASQVQSQPPRKSIPQRPPSVGLTARPSTASESGRRKVTIDNNERRS